jgi:hypothetical protein
MKAGKPVDLPTPLNTEPTVFTVTFGLVKEIVSRARLSSRPG